MACSWPRAHQRCQLLLNALHSAKCRQFGTCPRAGFLCQEIAPIKAALHAIRNYSVKKKKKKGEREKREKRGCSDHCCLYHQKQAELCEMQSKPVNTCDHFQSQMYKQIYCCCAVIFVIYSKLSAYNIKKIFSLRKNKQTKKTVYFFSKQIITTSHCLTYVSLCSPRC